MADHRRAPRRRGGVLEDAILRAALEEIHDVGYAAMSMERVAARASTSKAALYRRWPSKPALAVAAGGRFGRPVSAPPDTGSLRGDVLALLHLAIARAGPVAPMMLGLLADTGPDQELGQQVRNDLVPLRPSLMSEVLERAVARGEVPQGGLPAQVVTLPLDLLRGEMILNGPEVSDDAVAGIVDDVFLPLATGRNRPGPG